MKLRVTAKRWDEPVELEAEEITLRHVQGNVVQVTLDGVVSQHPIELHPELGERVEVIA